MLGQVLGNAVKTVSIGLAFGLGGAFALTRVAESLLYEVSPLDPMAITAACAAMTLVGLLAAFAPARRAAGVKPLEALRGE